MGLINGNTRWILFLSASTEPEDRHVLDLAFGLQCLELAGIQQPDIYIYIDGNDRQLLGQLISIGSANNHIIKESKDFAPDLAANTHENLVMFVTGHGSIQGIDAPAPITPYALLNQIKGTPCIKHAVLYLGQCHAGIFNYISAGKRLSGPGGADPDIIIVGATNLHESISSSTKEAFVGGPMTWVANLFLLHTFKWISGPIDVDGDGKKTIIDSYKYAGAMSNDANKTLKITSFVHSVELHGKWVAAMQAHKAAPTPKTQLALDAVTAIYQNQLDINYTHQECWILNAIPAQSIEF